MHLCNNITVRCTKPWTRGPTPARPRAYHIHPLSLLSLMTRPNNVVFDLFCYLPQGRNKTLFKCKAVYFLLFIECCTVL